MEEITSVISSKPRIMPAQRIPDFVGIVAAMRRAALDGPANECTKKPRSPPHWRNQHRSLVNLWGPAPSVTRETGIHNWNSEPISFSALVAHGRVRSRKLLGFAWCAPHQLVREGRASDVHPCLDRITASEYP